MRELAGLQVGARRGQLVVAQKCAAEGCNGLAYGDDFCARCEEEIQALERMAEEDSMRVSRALYQAELKRIVRRYRYEPLRRALRKWFRALEVAFLAAGLMYLGLEFGAAWIDWVRR